MTEQREINFIRDNYKKLTYAEMADELNITKNKVIKICRNNGWKKQIHNSWSQEDIDYLKEHYIDMTSKQIGKHTGHSINAVNGMRDRLGLIRCKSWTSEEEDYLREHYMDMTHEEIGKVLNRPTKGITAKCLELNLYKKELPWNDYEIEFLKSNYMNMPKKEIAEYLNRTSDAVQCRANKLGLKKSPYTCNYHFFDVIDTEEKAYWLGFITADGWASKNKENNSGSIGIELQYGDIDHLRKFNKSIEGNYKIVDRRRTCTLSGKKTHECNIRVYSIIMFNSISKYGINGKKTTTIKMPELDYDLVRHYFRGFFDGDGCFGYTDRSFTLSILSASKDLMYSLIDVVRVHLGIEMHGHEYTSEYGTDMYRYFIYKKDEKINFLNWLYDGANIYLDRKYKKYQKVLQDHNESLAS